MNSYTVKQLARLSGVSVRDGGEGFTEWLTTAMKAYAARRS